MTKIITYRIKSPVVASDEWIGSNGVTGETVNFSAELVATYVASTLTPEQGGVLKVTEIDIDTLVTDISTTVNALSPNYQVASYETLFFFIEGVVYVLKVMNVTIGIGGVTLTNDDFITFPINTGENGLDADMTRVSTTSRAIVSSGSLSFSYPSSLNLGWAVGTRLRVSANSNNYMEGEINSLSPVSVTIVVDNFKGSGTYASWRIGIAGDKGIDGVGISSIELLSTVGYIKTYRINFTDATTFDYTVLDGTNGLNADMTRISTTSNAIVSSGSKTFTYTISNNLGWIRDMRLRIAHDVNNYMEGIITSVTSTTLIISVDYSIGSGTYASWNIGVAGDKGLDYTSDNLQKTINVTTNYTILAGDNNYSVLVNNGSNDVTITVPAGFSSAFICAFTQLGSGDVTFVTSSTTINTPIGLLIKGQFYAVALEQIGATNVFNLLGNSKA